MTIAVFPSSFQMKTFPHRSPARQVSFGIADSAVKDDQKALFEELFTAWSQGIQYNSLQIIGTPTVRPFAFKMKRGELLEAEFKYPDLDDKTFKVVMSTGRRGASL